MNPRIILSSKAVSLAGDSIFNIGFPLFLVDKTGRADILGYSLALQMLTFLVVTLFGGFIADKARTLKSCVVIDFLRFILVLILLWICQYAFSVSTIIPLLMLLSGLTALYDIILDGMTMRIASHDDLGWLLSRSALCSQVFDAGGHALGGIILAILGFQWSFVLNAASFFVAGLLLVPYFNICFTETHQPNLVTNATQITTMSSKIKGFAEHLKLGFKISLSDRTIRSLLGLAICINIIAAAKAVMWFPLLRQTYRLNEMQIGVCSSIVAISIALFSFVAQKLAKKPERWIPLTLIAQILVVFSGVAFSLMSSTAGLVLGSMILGIAALLHSLPSAMLRKNRVPTNLQGSALAVARILSRLIMPVAMFIASWLQTKTDPSNIFLSITLIAAVLSLLPFFHLYSENRKTVQVVSL